jgi:uncharacterized membrane protein YgdD (TMEM256/DUF423 family)
MKPDRCIAWGAISGAVTVALGAFGAHSLKESLAPEQLAIWNTAVQYQGLHALALIGFGAFAARTKASSATAWLFLLGTLLFSGSLYALAGGAPRWFGAVTPLGGTAFIAGWITFAINAWRASQSDARSRA